MENSGSNQRVPGWGWPIAVVVVVHLALAAIPIEFSKAHSGEPATVELAMVTPPVFEEPEEPTEATIEPVEEPPEEVVEPVESQPEPTPAVQASEPEHVPAAAEVAVVEEPPAVEPEMEPEFEEEIAELDVSDEEAVEEIAAPEPLSLPERRPRRATEATESIERVDWNGYGQGVLQRVQQERDYPRMAERMGWEGTATVRITIGADGRLIGTPEIVESSRYDVLDEEVVRMVESAAPFAAFPEAANHDERPFVIPVRFLLEG